MKKIVSLIVAVSMLAASAISVNAAIKTTLTDGYDLIDASTLPANSELSARTPSVTFASTQLTTKDEVKANSTTAISNQWSLSTYDVYKVTATVTNLGELANGYDTEWGYAYAGVYQICIPFSNTFEKMYIASSQIAGGTAAMGQDTQTLLTNLQWAASSVTNPYPYFDENNDTGHYMENGTLSLTFLTAVTKGNTLVMKPQTTGNYGINLTYQATGQDVVKVTNITIPASYTLGEVAEFDEIETAEQTVIGTNATEGKYASTDGTMKALKHVANVLKDADATKKIRIIKTLNGVEETMETERTISDVLGGVAVENSKINAKVAIGVLTADTDAVFTFELF